MREAILILTDLESYTTTARPICYHSMVHPATFHLNNDILFHGDSLINDGTLVFGVRPLWVKF